MTEFYVQFGLRVKNARISARISQAELATSLGVARSSVANIESGRQRLPLHQLPLLARTLGLSIEGLVGEFESGDSVSARSVVPGELDMNGISDTARRFITDALRGSRRRSDNGAA